MAQREKIALVVTGGQVGTQFNKESKSLQPTVTSQQMISWLPESMTGRIVPMDWSHQPSSHYSMRMTFDLVQILAKTVIDGASGVVVSCGTDTMEEMAYLTDLYWSYPQPVVFTGSTMPSDGLGADAAANLYQAVLAAAAEETWGMGVLVCVQEQLFAASEVTETECQRKSAFSAPGRGPIGQFIADRVDILRQPIRSRIVSDNPPARDVELLYATLGGGDDLLEMLSSDKKRKLEGVVISAFGSGSVPPSWIPHIKKIIKDGVSVVVTSRCHQGHTSPGGQTFEGSFSRLLELGVLDGGHLRPVQARIKLAVALGAELKGGALQQYLLEG
ncbi:MAG TPA: asparaginase [Synergistaceae bacterium]|jgi:L-asparaginase|nr:asparaginase [Synergistaceae bacterium]